jgi:hypothetical protein
MSIGNRTVSSDEGLDTHASFITIENKLYTDEN